MQIFQTKWFARWATKEGLNERTLCDVVAEMELGLIDVNLGGHVYKKRISIGGRGKSGAVRTILAFKSREKTFFLYGFAKNQRDNIDDKELQALKKMASHLLSYDRETLAKAIKAGELIEVINDQT
ncbi:type II toxin-antitoxin system RelE/ParE family toxin [Massilia glaciei]|uniref:Type II toxin-antitoxin system RelE/ParE family toxin n=1 Tax=Massilia glaciei TaxID=1524097 RepID=A0A2U2HK50_9BURK|nr:type II toxin-antitoxin system RelE/ParE family toxin [Massilia glaciei]PWF47853.1 type II toxin-antitoxin system RelE/ParE family toxin [Massilia glaciei]